ETRAGHHRPGAAFQIRERIGKLITSRIAGAGVIVLARLTIAFEGKIRRQVNGRHYGTVLCIRFQPGAYRTRGDLSLTDVVAHGVCSASAFLKMGFSTALSFKKA